MSGCGIPSPCKHGGLEVVLGSQTPPPVTVADVVDVHSLDSAAQEVDIPCQDIQLVAGWPVGTRKGPLRLLVGLHISCGSEVALARQTLPLVMPVAAGEYVVVQEKWPQDSCSWGELVYSVWGVTAIWVHPKSRAVDRLHYHQADPVAAAGVVWSSGSLEVEHTRH